MLKRTKGYILLTLLVVTGLASQVTSPTISSKERRWLTHHLKETRSEVFQSVQGLSQAQLAFRPAPGQWTIEEHLLHLVLAEQSLRRLADATLQQRASAATQSSLSTTDGEILQLKEGARDSIFQKAFPPEKAPWKNARQAEAAFKENRAYLMKFVRTSTDDLRHHVVHTPYGPSDVYQLLLALSTHTAWHTRQIAAIKASADFPRH